ncbi:MAG: hypothetical protein NTU53_02070, partial [Planctomycetota bacterium]|nr:hypothetical protein [Planctomycetota bacterium]
LTPDQLAQLTAARLASRKIRRAVSVATFDGWTIAIFAALTFLCGLSSPATILLGLGMAGVSYVELSNAAKLRRTDPSALRRLAFNQFALAAMLILYALWSLHTQSDHKQLQSLIASEPAAAEMLTTLQPLVQRITVAIYASLIAVAILAQGGTALFYYTRTKYIQAYLAQTPPWILQLQKAGFAL